MLYLHFLVQAEVDGVDWVEMFDNHSEASWFIQELEEEFGNAVQNLVFETVEVARKN